METQNGMNSSTNLVIEDLGWSEDRIRQFIACAGSHVHLLDQHSTRHEFSYAIASSMSITFDIARRVWIALVQDCIHLKNRKRRNRPIDHLTFGIEVHKILQNRNISEVLTWATDHAKLPKTIPPDEFKTEIPRKIKIKNIEELQGEGDQTGKHSHHSDRALPSSSSNRVEDCEQSGKDLSDSELKRQYLSMKMEYEEDRRRSRDERMKLERARINIERRKTELLEKYLKIPK